jgi:hypothetical protein
MSTAVAVVLGFGSWDTPSIIMQAPCSPLLQKILNMLSYIFMILRKLSIIE